MEKARDDVYCHMIARRAVARAALHLGIDAMSQEALDALSGVLLAYLERLGNALSYSVESSGRSSAHCNVLDALRAAEQCTTAAVLRVHGALPEEAATATTAAPSQQVAAPAHTTTDPCQDMSWKGLAAFCFGPNWSSKSSLQESQQDRLMMNAAASASAQQAGGKVGPSAITDSASTNKATNNGWNAPYPEEISFFPTTVSGSKIANPHPLSEEVAQSLHDPRTLPQAAEDEEKELLQEIPDSVFTQEWGSLLESSKPTAAAAAEEGKIAGKRKQDGGEAVDGQQPIKKAKLNDGRAGATSETSRAPYVPNFYPAFPRPSDSMGRTVVDAETVIRSKVIPPGEEKTKEEAVKVRTALVNLDQNDYWGSGWDTAQVSPSQAPLIAVPTGRCDHHTEGPPQAQIVPLGRASGSRVSRILEGSMNAPTMS